jgi:hypothetical protein
LEHAAQFSEEDTETRAASKNLSREATLVNLQVSQLTRIKEHLHDTLYPVNVLPLLEQAIESAEQIIGENSFSVEFNTPNNYSILADGFLSLVFQSLFIYHVKKSKGEKLKFSITLKSAGAQQVISIVSPGEGFSDDLKIFMESKQDVDFVALDLNLYTAKLLLTRYNATIQCEQNENVSENTCILIFPSSK